MPSGPTVTGYFLLLSSVCYNFFFYLNIVASVLYLRVCMEGIIKVFAWGFGCSCDYCISFLIEFCLGDTSVVRGFILICLRQRLSRLIKSFLVSCNGSGFSFIYSATLCFSFAYVGASLLIFDAYLRQIYATISSLFIAFA